MTYNDSPLPPDEERCPAVYGTKGGGRCHRALGHTGWCYAWFPDVGDACVHANPDWPEGTVCECSSCASQRPKKVSP